MSVDRTDIPVRPARQGVSKGSPCPTAVHTGGVIQRLERLAGKKLSYREQRQEAEREQAAAKLAEAKAAEEAAKKPKESDPFVEQIFRFSPYVN